MNFPPYKTNPSVPLTFFSRDYLLCLLSLQLDGDIATVGITAHAANALGDIVYVELPTVGSEYAVGDAFGAVESVKAGELCVLPV